MAVVQFYFMRDCCFDTLMLSGHEEHWLVKCLLLW